MKRFALLVLLVLAVATPVAAAKTTYPEFSAPVVDAADVVPAVVEQRLDTSLAAYQQASGNQIGVAVVDTTGDRSIEDYTFDLFNKQWKLGDKEKDNGVLLVIAVKDRKLRIEVGSGLEGDLTDAQSGRIIQTQITPRLKDGDYGGAIEVGTNEIRRALGDTTVGAPPVTAAPLKQPADDQGGSWWLFVIAAIFLISAIGGGGRRRRRRWGLGTPIIWGGGFGGGGFGGGGGGGGGFGGGFGGGSSGGGASGGW
jgi:uncharacterized protein